MTDYNKNCDPLKRSKEFTSPANQDGGAGLGRTKAPKDEAAPRSPLADFEAKSKAESSGHKNA